AGLKTVRHLRRKVLQTSEAAILLAEAPKRRRRKRRTQNRPPSSAEGFANQRSGHSFGRSAEEAPAQAPDSKPSAIFGGRFCKQETKSSRLLVNETACSLPCANV
ncbi:MAG: hypothetical protein ABL901_14595, partial [Hyphomicrobiaceae bacterium]